MNLRTVRSFQGSGIASFNLKIFSNLKISSGCSVSRRDAGSNIYRTSWGSEHVNKGVIRSFLDLS